MTKNALRVMLIAASMVFLAAHVTSAQVTEMLPNLSPFDAVDIRFDANGSATLQFSTISRNVGVGPMELVGGPSDPVAGRQVVYQRVYLSNGTFYDRTAGTFEYHEEHFHFHLDGYAKYVLRPLGPSGGGDVESQKTSFCLLDNQVVNLTLPGAPQQPVYSTCNPDLQGISVGWGDKYGFQLPGQSFDVSGKPDGDYQLIIEIDPFKHLSETNDEDNISCVVVRLSVAARTVTNRGPCTSTSTNVTVSSITPNGITSGSTINVVIKGTGFAPGIAVGFENGSGPAPVASAVQVIDANTITARVSVKNGGPRRSRVWDVRVGPAVLTRGFTVTP
jgi:hypothetical protein